MFQKRVLVFWAVVFLVSASAFSWVETERVKLGVIIEGTTFITSGALAGKVAFIDDWNIYVNLLTGPEKLFGRQDTLRTIAKGHRLSQPGRLRGQFYPDGYQQLQRAFLGINLRFIGQKNRGPRLKLASLRGRHSNNQRPVPGRYSYPVS
jgi:hypothetical protein